MTNRIDWHVFVGTVLVIMPLVANKILDSTDVTLEGWPKLLLTLVPDVCAFLTWQLRSPYDPSKTAR